MFLLAPDQCRALGVIETQLMTENALGVRSATLLLQPAQQQIVKRAVPRAGDRQQRRQVFLSVDGLALIGLAIQMNGETRNDGDGLLHVDQAGAQCLLSRYEIDTPSD